MVGASRCDARTAQRAVPTRENEEFSPAPVSRACETKLSKLVEWAGLAVKAELAFRTLGRFAFTRRVRGAARSWSADAPALLSH